jgi:hypothetical protein
VIETRGRVSDADLAAVKNAGYTDSQVVEIVASGAQFLMTNFLNNVAEPKSISRTAQAPASRPAEVAGSRIHEASEAAREAPHASAHQATDLAAAVYLKLHKLPGMREPRW